MPVREKKITKPSKKIYDQLLVKNSTNRALTIGWRFVLSDAVLNAIGILSRCLPLYVGTISTRAPLEQIEIRLLYINARELQASGKARPL